MLLNSDTQLSRSSYYEVSCEPSQALPALQGDVAADVVVLEADRICSGASGRNGGQAIAGYASGQETFEHQLGKNAARRVWDMSIEAIDLIDQHIARHQIDCDRFKGYITVAASLRNRNSPGVRWLRMPSRVLGTAFHRLCEAFYRPVFEAVLRLPTQKAGIPAT